MEEKKIYKRPAGLQNNINGYCPGCFHPGIGKLIMAVLEEFDLLAAFLGLYIFDETSHSQEERLNLEQVVAMFPCRREWDSHGPTLEGITIQTKAETPA